MTAITEDTPEGGPEELQWKIDRLTEQVERHAAELKREQARRWDTSDRLTEALDQYETLTNRLTIGVLRKAGYAVTIKEAEVCDTCGEEYEGEE